MSRSEVYQIRCDEDWNITLNSHKLHSKEYIALKQQLNDDADLDGDLDWMFEEACDKLDQDIQKIVNKYYDTDPDFDVSIECEMNTEFYGGNGQPGSLIVTVNFDGLTDDESAECSSDEIVKNILNDVMVYLNNFSYTSDWNTIDLNDEETAYETVEFYCVVGHYIDPAKAIKLLNDYWSTVDKIIYDKDYLIMEPDEFDQILDDKLESEEAKQTVKNLYLAVIDLYEKIEENEGRITESVWGGRGKMNLVVESLPTFECFFSDVELV